MKKFGDRTALIVIAISLIVAYLIYTFILGNQANFVDGNPANEPLEDNFLGFIYKGGYVVIAILAMQLILTTYIIERFFTFAKASGKSDNHSFVQEIKTDLNEKKVDQALKACDEQKGTIGNMMKEGLQSLQSVTQSDNLGREQKLAMLRDDIEEAVNVEVPVLEHNIPIISTIASVATLVGLLGTVLGMIKAFQALAQIGAPDSVGLANGISQALVTTALGIGTAAVGIIFYNYFSNKLDKITDAMEEGSYTLIQHLKKTHPIKTKAEIHA